MKNMMLNPLGFFPDIYLDSVDCPEFEYTDGEYAMLIYEVEKLTGENDAYRIAGKVSIEAPLGKYDANLKTYVACDKEQDKIAYANQRNAEYVLRGECLEGGVVLFEEDNTNGNAEALAEVQKRIEKSLVCEMRCAVEQFLQKEEETKGLPDVLINKNTDWMFAYTFSDDDFYAMNISDVEKLTDDVYKITGNVDMKITLDGCEQFDGNTVVTCAGRVAQYILDDINLEGGIAIYEEDNTNGNAEALSIAQDCIDGDAFWHQMKKAAEKFLWKKERMQEQAKDKCDCQTKTESSK